MNIREVVIVSAVRSAVGRGKKDGSLANTHPIDLSAAVLKSVVERVKVEPTLVDDVLWGCAMPEASQGLNVSRLALLRAGFPVSVSGATVNRFCSSGLQTVAMGAQAIMSGMQDVVVAGGVEMMSAVPMSGFNTRLHPEMTETNIGMGFTAERVAKRWGITREMQDAFALESQQKAAAAHRFFTIALGALRTATDADMQITWARTLIGIAITLTEKISPANTEPTARYATMKLMFCGSSNAISEPLKSGMPSKLSANTISEARPQSISRISSTPPKIITVFRHVRHATNDVKILGCSPRSRQALA